MFTCRSRIISLNGGGDAFTQEVLISSKNGIGEGLQPVPPEQEGGKEKNKSFPLQGVTQRDTSVTTWDQLMSLPAVENFCFFSFPPSCSGGTGCNPSPIPFLPLKALPISVNVELPWVSLSQIRGPGHFWLNSHCKAKITPKTGSDWGPTLYFPQP